MGVVDLFGIVGGSGVIGGVVVLLFARNMNKKLKAETGKLSADSVAVLSNSSIALLAPLTARLHEVEQQCKDVNQQLAEATDQVVEVKRELAAAHLLVDDLNGKLDEANTRSAYFEDQWCIATGRPLPKRNPPTATQGNN
jgi:gas vesicle protein